MTLRPNTSEPVLVEGRTCWRIARAAQVAVIVDAAAYFAAVKAAILAARHSVLLIGWDFDTRITLEHDDPDPAVPNSLGDFLTCVVRRNRGLSVYVLRWDLAFLKMPFRGTTPLFLLDWLTSRRLHFRLDPHHPPGACHHQKIAVIDDAIAFCGGIDMTLDRWDTPEHRDGDARRTRPDGSIHGPWHDATTAVDGDAARALGELARDRWFVATGRRLEAPPPGLARWPESLPLDFRDVEVAIARTEPAYRDRKEAREIEALHLAAIRSAERTIYLESQYFSSHRIAGALQERLEEENGPEIVIVNPRQATGWLEEEAMGSARAYLLKQMKQASHSERLRVYTPVTREGADIYVHAKVMVVDDCLLRVGSSNINNRSMGLDTECDLAIEARDDDPRAPELRRAIRSIRNRLLCEHLACAEAELERALDQTGGSLIRAVDRLARPQGRSLRPFEPPPLSETERRLVEQQALDPSRPETMAETFMRTLQIVTFSKAAALSAALAAAGILSVLGRRLAHRLRKRA